MAHLAFLFYHFIKEVRHMDYIEIMNFCGYDLDKAHEMAKQRGTVDFSETIKELIDSTQQEQEDADVHILPA